MARIDSGFGHMTGEDAVESAIEAWL